VLASVTRADVSHEAMGFMAIADIDIGMVPALVGRVSYTGDLGYEIWVKPEYLRTLFTTLMTAGEPFDIALFGMRALNALRLEKNFGSWGREYRPIYYPVEAGLDRFIAFDKDADFIGKTAAYAVQTAGGGTYRLRSFIVSAKDADVIGDEPLFHNGEVAGFVTSGGFAHASGVSVAMGYVKTELADEEEGWSLELLAEFLDARMQKQPLFDSNSSRMRS
jgi:dimethylglycine dehydrogenase